MNPLSRWAVAAAVASISLGAGGATPAVSAAPARLSGTLRGVVCPSASDCIVVGDSPLGSERDTRPIVGDFNGPGWSLAPLANPTAAPDSGHLDGVACPLPTTCFGVGFAARSAPRALIARWNGSAWSGVAGPAITGARGAVLDAIACPTPTKCFAVGNSSVGTKAKTLVERWTPSGWTVAASPSPHGTKAAASLLGIACPKPTLCFAVGGSYDRTTESTWLEQWNGTNWSTAQVPSPPKTAVDPHLAAISCASSTNCMAVGYYIVRQKDVVNARLGIYVGAEKPIIERWNGTSWTLFPDPLPKGSKVPNEIQLNGVACPAPTLCFAVGTSLEQLGDRTLTAAWNGKTWSRYPASALGQLHAIWCRSTTQCVAVGTNSIVEKWNGSKWSGA